MQHAGRDHRWRTHPCVSMLRQEDDDTRSNADRVHRHQATRVIQVVSYVSSGDQLCTIDPGDTFYTLQNQVLVGVLCCAVLGQEGVEHSWRNPA
eukprot:COSAG01_NODE_469_length_16584_cov_10.725265_16_plen_94_part_00